MALTSKKQPFRGEDLLEKSLLQGWMGVMAGGLAILPMDSHPRGLTIHPLANTDATSVVLPFGSVKSS